MYISRCGSRDAASAFTGANNLRRGCHGGPDDGLLGSGSNHWNIFRPGKSMDDFRREVKQTLDRGGN